MQSLMGNLRSEEDAKCDCFGSGGCDIKHRIQSDGTFRGEQANLISLAELRSQSGSQTRASEAAQFARGFSELACMFSLIWLDVG